jgi:hypothetical protein
MDQPENVRINEWQIEGRPLPVVTLDQQGKPSIGERTVKQRYMLSPLIPHTICDPDRHYFQYVDNGRHQDGRVLVRCRDCSVGKQFRSDAVNEAG